MGFSISKFLEKFQTKEDQRLLMVGLDAAGKTTILYKLKLGQAVSTVPTIGFNIENVEYKNLRFTIWDIGGQDHAGRQFRRLEKHYYHGTKVLIFVLDSSDKERIGIAKEELMRMLDDEVLQNCPLLIFANKADKSVFSIEEIVQRLELRKIKNKWYVQSACAIKGDGLIEGLDWVAKVIKNNQKN